MKRILLPIFTNLCFAAIIYQWFFAGSVGAHNVAVFLIWLHGTIGVICLVAAGGAVKRSEKKPSRIVRFVATLTEGFVISMLVWRGEFMLSVVYLFAIVGTALYLHETRPRAADENIST